MKIEELQNIVEQQNETIEELKSQLSDYKKEFDITKDLLEKHKHSGKETSDISNILSDRLGIKVATVVGAAEAVSIDIMGVVKSQGRAATGIAKVYDLFGNSFGMEWSGGGDSYFTLDVPLLLKTYSTDPTARIGQIWHHWEDTPGPQQFRGCPWATDIYSFDMTAI